MCASTPDTRAALLSAPRSAAPTGLFADLARGALSLGAGPAHAFASGSYPAPGDDDARRRTLTVLCEGGFDFTGKRLRLEGPLVKQSKGGPQLFQFLLLDTHLVYASPAPGRERYKVHHALRVSEVRVLEDRPLIAKLAFDPTTSFSINSPEKSFVVTAADAAARRLWMEALEAAARLAAGPDYDRTPPLAVVLHPFATAKDCSVCCDPFSVIKTKCHCSSCGNVVCHNCSPDKMLLERQSSGGSGGGLGGGSAHAQRVCATCYRGKTALFVPVPEFLSEMQLDAGIRNRQDPPIGAAAEARVARAATLVTAAASSAAKLLPRALSPVRTSSAGASGGGSGGSGSAAGGAPALTLATLARSALVGHHAYVGGTYPAEGDDEPRRRALGHLCEGAGFSFEGKRLLREGPLGKHGRDGVSTYQFLLLASDLAYLEAVVGKPRYKLHNTFPLTNVRLKADGAGAHSFTILTTAKSFVVSASDEPCVRAPFTRVTPAASSSHPSIKIRPRVCSRQPPPPLPPLSHSARAPSLFIALFVSHDLPPPALG